MKAEGILSKLVEALGVDPCLLTIVAVLAIAAWIIHRTYAHTEKMQLMQLEQNRKLTEKRRGSR